MNRQQKSHQLYHCIPCNRKMPINDKVSHDNSKKHKVKEAECYSGPNTTLSVKRAGNPLDPKHYKSFFGQFGPVKWVNYNQVDKEIDIVFSNVNDMLSALKVKGNLYLKGSKLLIMSKSEKNILPEHQETNTNDRPKPKLKLKNQPNPRYGVPPKPDLPPASSFNLSGDFNQQLMTLMREIRLKPQTVERLVYLCEDTERALGQRFAGCHVIPFGSIVNGLAILDSDVDCYADIPDHYGNYNNAAFKSNYINVAKKALLSHPALFSHVFMIPSAKVPIIKYRHIPTGFNVDINFKSSFGIINTDLIRFFISTDVRLTPLFVLIKYWAKLNELTGPNKFSNYSMILMVIFYLQRLPKPILPPVQFIQNDPRCDIIRDGWNVGFDTSLHNFPKNHNDSNVLTLLEGFFRFYTSFQLDTVVLSPLTGLSLPISVFRDMTQLPPDFHRYVSLLNVANKPIKQFPILNTLNVQDPFELNRNVTAPVSLKLKKLFISACRIALMKIQDAQHTQCFEGLLYKLLNAEVAIEEIPPKKMSSVTKVYRIKRHGVIPNQLVTLYCERLKSLVENILTNVLKCRFTAKTLKLKKRALPRMLYKCDSFYNLWSTRKNHTDQVNGDPSTLAWYVSVSDHIWDLLYKNQLPTCPLFSFSIELDVNILQKRIFIILGNMSAPSEMFIEFIDFITAIFDMGMNFVLDDEEGFE